jgi:hypothetical protein
LTDAAALSATSDLHVDLNPNPTSQVRYTRGTAFVSELGAVTVGAGVPLETVAFGYRTITVAAAAGFQHDGRNGPEHPNQRGLLNVQQASYLHAAGSLRAP